MLAIRPMHHHQERSLLRQFFLSSPVGDATRTLEFQKGDRP
ncbi:hypothetical protein [Nostoc sp. KVJ3]|nr:hypothetical protein [Nostoc sp. KVJ3]